MYIFMNIVSCYDVKDVDYSFSKNIHLQKIYYISGRWRREEGAAASMRKRVVVRGFHFISSLFNHGSPVNLLRLLCRGPCKKLHNQKYKTYFTIILTDITEITIF